jgi:hypothetical protein
MSKAKAKSKGKKSAVVHVGTGSGHGVKAGSTHTPESKPTDDHKLGRAPAGSLK